jgi:hypothetical protein
LLTRIDRDLHVTIVRSGPEELKPDAMAISSPSE